MIRKFIYTMTLITIGVLALVGTMALTPITPRPTPTPRATATHRPPQGYAGDVLAEPVHVRDFEVSSTDPEVTRWSDLDGQWRLVFFGYLHCPDYCPLTLAEYRRIKRELGDRAEAVDFLYITVDPARDTPEVMQRYLGNFDPEFIGLAADDATLAEIQPDFGFYYERRMQGGLYAIDHSTRTYLVSPDGDLVTTFTYDIAPADIADAVEAWMDALG